MLSRRKSDRAPCHNDRLSTVKGIFTEPKRNLMTSWEWTDGRGPRCNGVTFPAPIRMISLNH